MREPDPDQVSLVAYGKRKDFLEISLNSHKANNNVEPIYPVLAQGPVLSSVVARSNWALLELLGTCPRREPGAGPSTVCG